MKIAIIKKDINYTDFDVAIDLVNGKLKHQNGDFNLSFESFDLLDKDDYKYVSERIPRDLLTKVDVLNLPNFDYFDRLWFLCSNVSVPISCLNDEDCINSARADIILVDGYKYLFTLPIFVDGQRRPFAFIQDNKTNKVYRGEIKQGKDGKLFIDTIILTVDELSLHDIVSKKNGEALFFEIVPDNLIYQKGNRNLGVLFKTYRPDVYLFLYFHENDLVSYSIDTIENINALFHKAIPEYYSLGVRQKSFMGGIDFIEAEKNASIKIKPLEVKFDTIESIFNSEE